MARYKLTLRYDGSRYHGWQVQKNAVTVQETVQNAMEEIFSFRPALTGCSRTDTGVHANMFCCHFDLDTPRWEQEMIGALNARLPRDIAVWGCDGVPDDFHARYSSKGKQYIYRIHNHSCRDPFLEMYALHIKSPLDLNRMNRAGGHFVGRHDFKGFCSSGSDVKDTVRRVRRCDAVREDTLVTVTVEADGFLYNMARIITGTLLYVSRGRIGPDDIPGIIEGGDRSAAGYTVPAAGLYLNRVYY